MYEGVCFLFMNYFSSLTVIICSLWLQWISKLHDGPFLLNQAAAVKTLSHRTAGLCSVLTGTIQGPHSVLIDGSKAGSWVQFFLCWLFVVSRRVKRRCVCHVSDFWLLLFSVKHWKHELHVRTYSAALILPDPCSENSVISDWAVYESSW